jgi:hypothetical protein
MMTATFHHTRARVCETVRMCRMQRRALCPRAWEMA